MPEAPTHGKAANLSTVAIRKAGSRRYIGSSTATTGKGRSRVKSHSKFVQTMCSSRGLIIIGEQFERLGRELSAAPRAVLERNRRRPALRAGLELPHLAPGVATALVALETEHIGCCCLPHPQANLDGPFPVARDVLLALELEGAHKASGTRKLIQREQAQSIPHDHAHSGTLKSMVARVTKSSQHHRESRQSEVGFGLAAPVGKKSRSTVSR